MRLTIISILVLFQLNSFSQIAIIQGIVSDSTQYGYVEGAELHFIKNDTTILSGLGGGYSLTIRKSLEDTIVVTHYLFGTIKIPFNVRDKEKLNLVIHYPFSCKGVKRTNVCPKCKTSNNVIKILYGLPNEKGMKSAAKGEVHLGGCVINDCSPKYFCKKDSLEF